MHYYALFCIAILTTWLLTGMQSEAQRVNRALFPSVTLKYPTYSEKFQIQYPDFYEVHI
jgi:hypothetical protein